MKTLSFSEVRAAGLPARVELAYAAYEYRPLADEVVVHIASAPQSFPCTTHRMPAAGWLHEEGCRCSYCREAGQALPAAVPGEVDGAQGAVPEPERQDNGRYMVA
jgi:hypothetical protein